ncbi:MAG: hypothetical protein LBD45_05045 [Bacteroidales bacterium]|jgi:hypothetical protein|nr:hypothetical protein [Bacteroidales bacterium]
MKTDRFNLNRMSLLFRRYFTERLHTELIYWGIMIIVFMFIRNQMVAIGGLIFVAGAFYAARFSREIHSPTNGCAYFMIPATQLEKWIVAILMTSLYYFLMMILTYILGNLLGTCLNNMLASIDFLSSDLGFFHPSTLQWKLFGEMELTRGTFNGVNMGERISFLSLFFRIFLLIQSVYLLGGVYFRRNQAFTTFFTTNIIQLLLLILFIVELRLIIGETSVHFYNFTTEDALQLKNVFQNILRVFFYLLPPFFWVTGYFRLTEKQV